MPLSTEDLWAEFRARLRRHLAARLPTEADADDVLQEVFLRIHEGADRLPEVDDVRGWLFTIARRAVADFYRARARRGAVERPVEEADAWPAERLAGPDGDVHEEVLSWLVPMIDDLPTKYRTALRMADVEGRTQQAVADALGLSLSGAKSRVQRGRALLGEALRRCCAVEFGGEGRAVSFQRLRPSRDGCGAAHCAAA